MLVFCCSLNSRLWFLNFSNNIDFFMCKGLCVIKQCSAYEVTSHQVCSLAMEMRPKSWIEAIVSRFLENGPIIDNWVFFSTVSQPPSSCCVLSHLQRTQSSIPSDKELFKTFNESFWKRNLIFTIQKFDNSVDLIWHLHYPYPLQVGWLMQYLSGFVMGNV